MEKRIGRKRRVSRIKKSLAAKQQVGQRVSGKVPYGWSLADDGKTLIPNDAEQDAICEIWWLMNTGNSYRSAASELDRAGLKPRNGGKWQASTVRAVHLTAEKYLHLLSHEQHHAIQQRRLTRRRGGKPAFTLPPIPKPPEPGEEWSDEWFEFVAESEADRKTRLKEFKSPY